MPHWYGRTANSSATAPAMAHSARDRVSQARRTSHSSAGTTQTQWCCHVMGETSRMAVAQMHRASSSSPRRWAQTASASAAAATATASTSHTGAMPCVVCAHRTRRLRSDWLRTFCGSPTRLLSRNVPPQ
jgi:hypothetical protein